MVYVNLLEGTFGCSIGAVFLLKSNKWTKDVYFAPLTSRIVSPGFPSNHCRIWLENLSVLVVVFFV
jgi:hypothetical protein